MAMPKAIRRCSTSMSTTVIRSVGTVVSKAPLGVIKDVLIQKLRKEKGAEEKARAKARAKAKVKAKAKVAKVSTN